jgi:2-hydroxychromene-2-carboxylate isomerase
MQCELALPPHIEWMKCAHVAVHCSHLCGERARRNLQATDPDADFRGCSALPELSAMTSSGAAPQTAPGVEFWFDFGSNYSYLSVMRIEDAARQRGVRVIWKPFLLGPIFRALGMETSPFVLQKEKGAYVWQDMVRQARKYALQWTKPSTFPRSSVLASRIALLAADEPWIVAFCRQVMELNFVLDEDITRPERLARLLDRLGLPTEEILNQAQAEPAKARLREQTEDARRRGIFGAPTFFVGTEMFWGNDRLDDALLFACEQQP